MIVIRILAYLIGIFGVVGTILPFLKYDDYWIRGFDYPRSQLVFVLSIAFTLWLISNADWDDYDFLIGGALLMALGHQVAMMLPYTSIYPVQSRRAEQAVTRESSVSLLVCNVLQTNRRYTDVIDLAKELDPDLFLTLESNQDWEDELDRGLSHRYPHRVNVPLENLYGMHLFSKFGLHAPRVKYRIKDDIPSIETHIVLGNGEEVDLYFLHPMPPSPSEAYASTGRDAELAQVGLKVKERNRNAIVAGDMNDVAWSHSSRLFQRLSGLLDPRRGRGLYATFHADFWWARWPLDHVFHSTDLAVVKIERQRHVGSDHFPMYVKFNFEHNVSEGQQLRSKADDREEARGVIEHGKADQQDVLIEP